MEVLHRTYYDKEDNDDDERKEGHESIYYLINGN